MKPVMKEWRRVDGEWWYRCLFCGKQSTKGWCRNVKGIPEKVRIDFTDGYILLHHSDTYQIAATVFMCDDCVPKGSK